MQSVFLQRPIRKKLHDSPQLLRTASQNFSNFSPPILCLFVQALCVGEEPPTIPSFSFFSKPFPSPSREGSAPPLLCSSSLCLPSRLLPADFPSCRLPESNPSPFSPSSCLKAATAAFVRKKLQCASTHHCKEGLSPSDYTGSDDIRGPTARKFGGACDVQLSRDPGVALTRVSTLAIPPSEGLTPSRGFATAACATRRTLAKPLSSLPSCLLLGLRAPTYTCFASFPYPTTLNCPATAAEANLYSIKGGIFFVPDSSSDEHCLNFVQ